MKERIWLYYNVPGPPGLFSKGCGKQMRMAANWPCYPSVSESGREGYLDRRLHHGTSFPNCVGLSTCQQMMDMYLLFLRPNSVEIPVTAGEFEIGSTTSVAEAWWDHACFCMKDWMRGIDFYINKREQLRPSCTFSARPSFQSCRDTTAVFRPRYCQQTLYSLACGGEIHGHT